MAWLMELLRICLSGEASNKLLCDKAFNIAKSPKYDGYQRSLASMVCNFFIKSLMALLLQVVLLKVKLYQIKNQLNNDQKLLLENVIKKFVRRKVHSSSIDNIWGGDLVDMHLISKFNKGICFLLCVIDIFNKYTWVVPLKKEKGITITNAFQNFLDKSNRKSNKMWADKGSQFYERSVKSWLQYNDKEIYSTLNEENSVVAEKFIRTLKNKIFKYMASVSKNVYVDKLDEIANLLM